MKNQNGVPCVALTLDRERHICFSLPAVFRIEDATGVCLAKAEKEDVENLFSPESTREQMENVVTLLHATLSDEDRELTRDQVFAMLHLGNLGYATGKLMDAFRATFGGDEEESPESDPTPAASL